MASTGAVPQFGYGVEATPSLFVFVRSEIVGVASRAIGCVGGTWPRHLLRISLVARGTIQFRAMITWIPRTVVHEPDRRPVGRVVALVALDRRLEVRGRLPSSLRTVVAGRTGAGHALMVKACRYPGERGVAIAALSACRDVECRFARGEAPIVAGAAGSSDRIVIHPHIGPGGDQVAVIAGCRRWDMGRRLASRCGAIVAGGTRAGHGRVIEPHICPGRRDVAAVASGRGRDVTGWFAGRRRPVVT